MPDFHDDVSFGDDWTIFGTLTNDDGNPLDQRGASYEWALVDPDGVRIATSAVTIEPVEPESTSGKVTIRVPESLTALLAPGRFTDTLRVHDGGGMRSTLWSGAILVSANVFAAA